MAFKPNFSKLPCINHIDGNPLNNSIDNLEWCSYEQNVYHAYLNRLNREPNEIVLLNTKTKESMYFTSMATASEFLKKNKGFISNSLKQGKSDIEGYRIFITANMEDAHV